MDHKTISVSQITLIEFPDTGNQYALVQPLPLKSTSKVLVSYVTQSVNNGLTLTLVDSFFGISDALIGAEYDNRKHAKASSV